MIRTLHEGLLADGIKVSLVKLCAWFGVPRRTVYYKPTKAAPKVDPRFAEPIRAMIEENPSFGYRTVAFLLGFNKNTVQRIFQLKHWQVRKRPIGMRPRIQALPSVATAPNERWSTDLCRIWAGKDGWTSLALVIDCHTRELLGWHLSRTGKATTAASALEHALVRSYGLKQEFITPHCPQQNGMVERVIRTLKEQCVHRHRFESIQHAVRAIGDWIPVLQHPPSASGTCHADTYRGI